MKNNSQMLESRIFRWRDLTPSIGIITTMNSISMSDASEIKKEKYSLIMSLYQSSLIPIGLGPYFLLRHFY